MSLLEGCDIGDGDDFPGRRLQTGTIIECEGVDAIHTDIRGFGVQGIVVIKD